MKTQELIQQLNLEKHIEGGYFRRTFEASHRAKITTPAGQRFCMTSIYYMLTSDSPVGYFHRNTSDIAHFFHGGDPLEYYLISPAGELHQFTLGNNPAQGQHFQYVVFGGWWKATRLSANGSHGYGLISEAVAPGFDYDDMTLGKTDLLCANFPQHQALIHQFSRNTPPLKQ